MKLISLGYGAKICGCDEKLATLFSIDNFTYSARRGQFGTFQGSISQSVSMMNDNLNM